MEQFLGDAKRLVQRLHSHDNAVDILIGQTTNLQNKLIAMRQYHEEVNKLNEKADHRPRSTLILGSQLENQRIQNLEQENRELSISLAEHQSALELIMNKYREQILVMMKNPEAERAVNKANGHVSSNEIAMKEKIAEMANVMRQSALIDETIAAQEIEVLRSLQLENENLRELLEISGKKAPKCAYDFDKLYRHFSDGLATENISSCNGVLPAVGSTNEKVVSSEGDNSCEGTSSSLEQIGKARRKNFDAKPKYYDSLEKLFMRPENVTGDQNDIDDASDDSSVTPLHVNSSENYFVSTDPSENCFRAIITDIKPLEQGFDVNKDDIIPFELNHTKQSSSIQSGEASVETPTLETDSEQADIPDEISQSSNVHDSSTNEVVKQHFKPEPVEEYDKAPDANINIVDEFEEELMRNFASVIEAADSKKDEENVSNIAGPNASEEDEALGVLDNVLDFDDGDEIDTDDDDEDHDSEEFVDEIMENVSSDEEDANDEFSFHTTERNKDHDIDENNLADDPSSNHSQETEDIHDLPDSSDNAVKNQKQLSDSKFNDIDNKDDNTLRIKNSLEINGLKEENSESSLSNGEISDTDSEITITSEDFNEALAGFDSIIDDFDDANGELD